MKLLLCLPLHFTLRLNLSALCLFLSVYTDHHTVAICPLLSSLHALYTASLVPLFIHTAEWGNMQAGGPLPSYSLTGKKTLLSVTENAGCQIACFYCMCRRSWEVFLLAKGFRKNIHFLWSLLLAGACLENNERKEGETGSYGTRQTETCLPSERRGSLALTQLCELLSPLLFILYTHLPVPPCHASCVLSSYFYSLHLFSQLHPLTSSTSSCPMLSLVCIMQEGIHTQYHILLYRSRHRVMWLAFWHRKLQWGRIYYYTPRRAASNNYFHW